MNVPRTFRIRRFDAASGSPARYDAFVHETKPGDTLLEALMDIRDDQDHSLAFRYSCRESVCGSCALVVNGRIALACRTQTESLDSALVVVEPLPNLKVEKDLIVDQGPFWEAYNLVEPYLHAEGEAPAVGYRIEENEMADVFEFINCILCGACYGACPVVRRDGRYIGPAALAKLYRFIADPRDRRSFGSLAVVDTPTGVWGCDKFFRCNEICPKSVRPADGIGAIRRRLVSARVRKLLGKD